MLQVELMFGRNIQGRLGVSATAWTRFVAREVTPRFPDGFSVMDVTSQWRDREYGQMVHEPGKLMLIVIPDDTRARENISGVVEAYKQQFHQQSVGLVTRQVCAAF